MSGTQRYYLDNALGSNLATTSSTGTVESRTEYDAYGVEYNVQAGTKSQFKFAGKHGYYTDDRSGLNLLGHRYYMSALGRFLTQDPIGHAGGLNLYQYCGNNPLVALDPDGLQQRSLTEAERGTVMRAIGLLGDTNQWRPARRLSAEAKAGRIQVNDLIPPAAGTSQAWFPLLQGNNGVIVLHPDAIPSPGTHVYDQTIIELASVLLHEWVHLDMQPKMNAWNEAFLEQRAYSYQIRWLNMNSWDSKSWNQATRRSFKNVAQQWTDNLRENYSLRPLKRGF